MEATEEQIMLSYKNGVNYFDTAYIYPGSEAALGEILHKNNIRDKVHIATKLPHYIATCASNCVGCGKCEKHCPQGIAIREKLSDAKKELETPLFKAAFKLIKKFTNY